MPPWSSGDRPLGLYPVNNIDLASTRLKFLGITPYVRTLMEEDHPTQRGVCYDVVDVQGSIMTELDSNSGLHSSRSLSIGNSRHSVSEHGPGS